MSLAGTDSVESDPAAAEIGLTSKWTVPPLVSSMARAPAAAAPLSPPAPTTRTSTKFRGATGGSDTLIAISTVRVPSPAAAAAGRAFLAWNTANSPGSPPISTVPG